MQSINGLTSAELHIDIRKFSVFARIISNDGMSPVVRDIFRFRAKEYFRNPDCVPTGFIGDIMGLLKKYDLHSYFSLSINAELFPSYSSWKRIVNRKVYKYDKEKLLSYVSESSDLTVSIFRSLPLILSGPLPLPFLISFPNFEIKSDLGEVMGCKNSGIPCFKERD